MKSIGEVILEDKRYIGTFFCLHVTPLKNTPVRCIIGV